MVVDLEPLGGAGDGTRTGGGPVADRRRDVMEQRDSTFVPHVLPIVRGSTVDFPNRDLVLHNLFSLSGPTSFDLGRYRIEGIPPGRYRAVAWHERACPVREVVDIGTGRSTTVDFTVPLEEAHRGQ